MSSSSDNLRKHSSVITDGPSRAGARSMLRPVGFSEEDFKKPIIGIASLWSMVTPCNMHIDKLAVEAAAGADSNGGKAIIFNTITIYELTLIPGLVLLATLAGIIPAFVAYRTDVSKNLGA